ncbi:MAG: RIP metalloprotease RseP [Alphaproteobacteria bacterium]
MLSAPPIWLIVVAFICAIGPLVFIHEMGHYLVARLFGVGAETFSIGFGREIAGWTDRRGTRWKVGWLPLGGYVRFVGDEHHAGEGEGSPSANRPDSFAGKPVWQRFLIVLAGPLANFILAILIFAAVFGTFGIPHASNVVGAVTAGSAAAEAGIEPGDRIVAVDGERIKTFQDVKRTIFMRPGEEVRVVIERGEQRRSLVVRIGATEEQDPFGRRHRIGFLGVAPSDQPELIHPPAWSLLPIATEHTVNVIEMTVRGLYQIITGLRSAEELGGPLRIAQVAGEQASLGFIDFVWLAAIVSINLGFINLLPVPMLDGGHLLFYTLEAVRRRPVSVRAQEWAFRGGLALLLALLLFTTVNDLGSFGLWDRLERLIG